MTLRMSSIDYFGSRHEQWSRRRIFCDIDGHILVIYLKIPIIIKRMGAYKFENPTGEFYFIL
jgi:hypothetical protein